MSIFTVRNPCRGERVNITFRWTRNRSSVSFGHWGRVLPAHVRKGSLVSANTESFLPGLLSVVLLVLLGWGLFFLIVLFTPCLELRCRASCCYWLFCWVRCEFGGRSSGQNPGGKQLGWFYLGVIVDWSLWMRSTLVWKGLPCLLNNDT